MTQHVRVAYECDLRTFILSGIVASAASAGVSRLTLLPSQLSSLLQMIPDLGTESDNMSCNTLENAL